MRSGKCRTFFKVVAGCVSNEGVYEEGMLTVDQSNRGISLHQTDCIALKMLGHRCKVTHSLPSFTVVSCEVKRIMVVGNYDLVFFLIETHGEWSRGLIAAPKVT